RQRRLLPALRRRRRGDPGRGGVRVAGGGGTVRRQPERDGGTGTTTIAAGATLRLTTDRKELHRVLESFGTTVFEGGSVWRASTGTFYNRSGAGFEATAAGSFYADLVNEEGATITLAHEGEFN